MFFVVATLSDIPGPVKTESFQYMGLVRAYGDLIGTLPVSFVYSCFNELGTYAAAAVARDHVPAADRRVSW